MLDFKHIVGHEDIKNHFKLSIKNKKISHAYLIVGEDDSGKLTLANAFARALQCENLDPQVDLEDIDACGVCPSCKQYSNNNHPDVIYVRKTKNLYDIGVDDIRDQVIGDIIIKPYSSPYKIYIIDEAEKLTEQAQNALLKTLEEPPEYATLILLTNSINSIINTVQSRAVTLQVKAIEKHIIKDYIISEHHIPDYQADLIATFAQGNLGKAITLSQNENLIEIKDEVVKLIKNLDNLDNYKIIDTVKNLIKDKNKDEIMNILDLIILWYRDVLIYKTTKNPNILLYKDELKAISKQCERVSYEGLQEILKTIEETKNKIDINVNKETSLQLMLFTIKENSND